MNKKVNNFGFTLVELLIVIALIGILATAIVATINPIEQVNKANDAKYKNDASELLAAVERYYASNLQYPWHGVHVCGTGTTSGTTCGPESMIGVNCQSEGIGVCRSSGKCDVGGELISSGELKDSFRTKEQFTTTEEDDMLHVTKGAGSDAVYVCFIPSSQTTRDGGRVANIFDSNSHYIVPTDPTVACIWEGKTATTCFVCVPEVGSIGVGSSSP